MLIVLYRISDKGNEKKEKLPISKIGCLENFISHFGKENLFVFADNCTDTTISDIKTLGISPQIISLGNSKSFQYILTYSINNFKDDDCIYFVEDDYIHLLGSKNALLEGLEISDYVTLYDHPDKYDYKNNLSRLLLSNSVHWREVYSTTMTFAAKLKTIKEDYVVIKYCTDKHIPNDFLMFTILTSKMLVSVKAVFSLSYWHMILLKMYFLRLPLLKKSRKIISSVPGYSTHIEIKYLSPTISWLDSK